MSSNGLSFLESEGSVGNAVLSQCDTEPAALKSVIYTPSDFKEAERIEEIFVCEQGRVHVCLFSFDPLVNFLHIHAMI